MLLMHIWTFFCVYDRVFALDQSFVSPSRVCVAAE